MHHWRHIKEAPKDGTEIRAFGPRVTESVFKWSDHYSVFGEGGCWTDGFCTLGSGFDLTHWVPKDEKPHFVRDF